MHTYSSSVPEDLLDPKSCVFGGAASQKVRAPMLLLHPSPRRQRRLGSDDPLDEDGCSVSIGWSISATVKRSLEAEGVVFVKSRLTGRNSGGGNLI